MRRRALQNSGLPNSAPALAEEQRSRRRWPLFLLLALLATPAVAAIPVQRVAIVATYPHDRTAFTEGLFWRDGRLFESTGLEGRSSIREVRLRDGVVLRRRALPPGVFGEGIVDWKDRLIGLEWQGGRGSVWSLDRFRPIANFSYKGEGWGLTRDTRRIIMSDGTDSLRFLDPVTLRETGRVPVRADGRPVDRLNELEWIDGEVWANIWQTDRIARIDPKSGRVKGWIDLTGLLSAADRVAGDTDVLNGIAWDAARRRLFVTGKNWPKLFEVKLLPAGR